MSRVIESVISVVGIITCCIGVVIVMALLLWLAGNAWIDASRKWRTIFRAENDILDYLRNRVDYERWKKEQEATQDAQKPEI